MRPTCGAVALLALLAVAAFGQETWEAHTQAAGVAAANGNLELAEIELQQALDIASTFKPGDPRLEASLETLARLDEDQGHLDRAQPLYELLIAAREYRAGASSPEVLDALSAAGRVALRAGDVPGAEAHFRRYVEVADATGKADHNELWQVLSLLARMGALQQKPEDALLYQRQAVAVMELDSSSDPANHAAMLESLAQLELTHGSAEAAESLLARAADLQRQAGHPEAAIATLSGAAAIALGAGQPDLAERLVERVLALEPGPDVALAARRSLAEAAWQRLPGGGTLATWLKARADTPELAKAAERLQALARVQRLTLPLADLGLVETLSRQVAVAARRGDLATAEQAQWQLVEGRRKAGGQGLAEALADLITIQLAAGKTAAAVASTNGLIEVMSFLFGPNDTRLRPLLERQITLLTRLGRKQEAKVIKKRLRG